MNASLSFPDKIFLSLCEAASWQSLLLSAGGQSSTALRFYPPGSPQSFNLNLFSGKSFGFSFEGSLSGPLDLRLADLSLFRG